MKNNLIFFCVLTFCLFVSGFVNAQTLSINNKDFTNSTLYVKSGGFVQPGDLVKVVVKPPLESKNSYWSVTSPEFKLRDSQKKFPLLDPEGNQLSLYLPKEGGTYELKVFFKDGPNSHVGTVIKVKFIVEEL